MFGNLLIGTGYGHFTNILVLDIALFCVYDASPLVVMLEIQKHEFHAALYIS